MRVPTLETPRLLIREFEPGDLDAAFHLLDVELAEPGAEPGAEARDARRRWLDWTALAYGELAALHQPPYGDRAIVLRESGRLVGACGFAPVLAPLGQIPGFGPAGAAPSPGQRFTAEVGLYWAISPAHRRQGLATEAGRALIDYGLAELNLRRIVATTEHDNAASTGVMRRLGLRIERNPFPDPPWLQVVGWLDA